MFKLKVCVKDDRKILILRRNVIRFPGKEPRRLLEADIFCVSFQKGKIHSFLCLHENIVLCDAKSISSSQRRQGLLMDFCGKLIRAKVLYATVPF